MHQGPRFRATGAAEAAPSRRASRLLTATAGPSGRVGRGMLFAVIAGAAVLALAAGVLRWPGADADADGVADRIDACPATPPGLAVDARGCCAVARAMASAVAALNDPRAPVMEIGEAWFLQRLAEQRADTALRALVAQTERRLANHRSARLLRPDAPALPLPEDPGRGILRLATYVSAPVGAPPARAAAFIDEFTAIPGTGYVLTHQFLVLEWARSVGLTLPEAIAGRRADLLNRIAAEQATDQRFSDLFAERAAILLAFGRPDGADADRWMEVIQAAGEPDGRWTSAPSTIAYDGAAAPARHPWVHTTGFVAAATGFYLQQRGRLAPPSRLSEGEE